MIRICSRYVKCGLMLFNILLFLAAPIHAQSKRIKVIELRNYLLRPGQRDNFKDSFEIKILDTLNRRGNHVLGQYTVKDAPDNFVWVRGFDDMKSRLKALQGFYASKYWQQHVSIPRKYVLNYMNVYLLKPLHISQEKIDSTSTFNADWFGKQKGVAIVDFYIANQRRKELLDFVRNTYDSVLSVSGVKDVSYWISEMAPNDYPLPAFQDKNLLVTITFFKNETEYVAAQKRIESNMTQEQKFAMKAIVTTKSTWELYPTKKSFSSEK